MAEYLLAQLFLKTCNLKHMYSVGYSSYSYAIAMPVGGRYLRR